MELICLILARQGTPLTMIYLLSVVMSFPPSPPTAPQQLPPLPSPRCSLRLLIPVSPPTSTYVLLLSPSILLLSFTFTYLLLLPPAFTCSSHLLPLISIPSPPEGNQYPPFIFFSLLYCNFLIIGWLLFVYRVSPNTYIFCIYLPELVFLALQLIFFSLVSLS